VSEQHERLPELSRDAAAAWQAFERSIAPDEDAPARVLERVRARTNAAWHTEPDEREDAPSEPQGARRAAAAVLVMKSAAISVGIAGTALLSIKLVVAAVQPPTTPRAPSPVVVPAVATDAVDPPAQPRTRPIATPIESQTVPVQAPTSLRGAGKPRLAAPAPAAAVTPDLLRAEIELMEAVRAAVRTGKYVRAIDLLETHRADFPNGTLVEERLAFHAIASCGLSRADGSERARAFAKSHPRSAQLAAVRAACDAAAIRPMDPAGRQQ
jgi:hypothetical protein